MNTINKSDIFTSLLLQFVSAKDAYELLVDAGKAPANGILFFLNIIDILDDAETVWNDNSQLVTPEEQ